MGTLGPELRAYTRQHFREEDEMRDFLSIPIISKLVGNPEETTLPETATSVSRAPPRPRHTRSSSAPVIHMMPFTGKLAHKLFNANFKIHHPPHQAKSSETREERETNKGVAEDILERQDQMHSITRSVIPKAAANRSHGNVREVEIEGIGRYRVCTNLPSSLHGSWGRSADRRDFPSDRWICLAKCGHTRAQR